MRIRATSRGLIFLASILILFACEGISSGQNNLIPPPINPADNTPANGADEKQTRYESIAQYTSFVPAPRDVIRPLIRAERALRENNTKDAVDLLGQLLAADTDEDYLVLRPGERHRAISLRERAFEIMREIPEQQLESYQLRFGIRARKLLETAIAEGDFAKVADVSRRYFFTDAGYLATSMLGSHHLDNGEVVAAANAFQRIYDYPPARRKNDPELSVMLATARAIAGEQSAANTVLLDLGKKYPAAKFEFLGREISIFTKNENPLAWLKKLIGESSLNANVRVYEWSMFRGNPQRNAKSATGFPLPKPRWSVPVLNDVDREKTVLNRQSELILAGATIMPAVHPLAVNNTIVMRSFDKLFGIDFKTGKRLWVFPSWDADTAYSDDEIVNETLAKLETLNRGPLWQRLFEDSVYGQVSSDGKSIFVIPFPGIPGTQRLKMLIDKGLILDDPMSQRNFNELAAVDIRRQGAFKWEVGGSTGLDEPKLASALFMGPPLPLGGKLYAICHQQGEVRLVVLDSQTGKLIWSQQLASLDERARNRKYYRLAGATPSFSDGVLACPTGVGSIVAVDIAARSLLWGHQYRLPSASGRIGPSSDHYGTTNPMDGLWRDCTISINGNSVVYTPVDYRGLVCLDLFTGKSKWKTPTNSLPPGGRKDSLYVATINDQSIVLVGSQNVRALDSETGAEVWSTSLAEYGVPSGRGYTDGNSYYVPTSAQKIIQIELADGNVVKTQQTYRTLGNLISYNGNIISHGVDHVAAFPMDEASKRAIAATEANGELTPAQSALKCQLLLQEGEIEAATELIAQVFEIDQSPVIRDLFAEATILFAKKDYTAAKPYIERHRQLLQNFDPNNFVAACVNGQINESDYLGAFNSLLQLIDNSKSLLDPHAQLSFTTNWPGMEDVAMSELCWCHMALGEISKNAESETRTKIDRLLSDWQQANDKHTYEQKLQIFRGLGHEHFDKTVHERLAEHFNSENNLLLASLVLNVNKERVSEKEKFAKEKFSNARQFQVTKANDFAPTGYTTASNWLIDFNKNANSQLSRNTLTQTSLPKHLRDYQFYFLSQTGEIEVVDAFGKILFRFNTRFKASTSGRILDPASTGHIQFCNDVLLVDIGSELFALDWFKIVKRQQPVLWSIDIGPKPRRRSVLKAENFWGEAGRSTGSNSMRIKVSPPSENSICYLDDNRLICLDVLTGRKLWQREKISTTVDQLVGNEEYVASWDGIIRDVILYDFESGKILQKKTYEKSQGDLWRAIGGNLLFNKRDRPKPDAVVKPDEVAEKSIDDSKFRLVVNLVNLSNDTNIWTREFQLGTVAQHLPNNEIAFLEPDNNFSILQANSGQTVFASKLNLTNSQRLRVNTIDVREIDGAYLIKLNAVYPPLSSVRLREDHIELRRFSYSQMLWDGYMTVVDKETKKPRWVRPVAVQHFQYSSYQPAKSPAIILARLIDRRSIKNGPRRVIQLMFVDVWTGRLLCEKQIPGRVFINHHIECKPSLDQLRVGFNNQQLIVQLENGESPPTPIADLLTANTAYPASNETTKPNTRIVTEKLELGALKDSILEEREQQEKRKQEIKKLIDKQKR